MQWRRHDGIIARSGVISEASSGVAYRRQNIGAYRDGSYIFKQRGDSISNAYHIIAPYQRVA